MRPKKIAACDCETDPFLYGRVTVPFLWGLYDGKDFTHFDRTEDFVAAVINQSIILYAHNGGKFDFMFLLDFITETKAQIINGRIVSMFLGKAELRDSYAIIPEPLKNFGDKKEIDIWKLEREAREEHRAEILRYLYYDCKSLYDGCAAYRVAAGKHKTIASNALAFSKRIGINPGKTNHRFDMKYRRFFFGGRTEVFQPGTHNNITVLDIHSAYPFAMTHNHANGKEFQRGGSLTSLPRDEIERSFIVLNCRSNGAFPKRVLGHNGGLMFPHAYDEFHVTGWEYLAAKEFDLIDREEILSIRTSPETINFKEYVEHWFKMKLENPKSKSKINYTIAKIMMNSLYGKLAQDISKYYDYKIVPPGTGICSEFEPGMDEKICNKCGGADANHGWILYTENPKREIHRRDSLWKYRFQSGVEWEGKNLYHNVATGASITGFTRAHLLRAIHTVGVHNIIYCDTDSLICSEGADLSGLQISENLGDWGIEDSNAPVGHFAGKKLYGIKCSDDYFARTGNRYKIASKGSKLAFEELERIVNGETIQWQSPAPSFSIDGNANFVVREIRSTAIMPAKQSGGSAAS